MTVQLQFMGTCNRIGTIKYTAVCRIWPYAVYGTVLSPSLHSTLEIGVLVGVHGWTGTQPVKASMGLDSTTCTKSELVAST